MSGPILYRSPDPVTPQDSRDALAQLIHDAAPCSHSVSAPPMWRPKCEIIAAAILADGSRFLPAPTSEALRGLVAAAVHAKTHYDQKAMFDLIAAVDVWLALSPQDRDAALRPAPSESGLTWTEIDAAVAEEKAAGTYWGREGPYVAEVVGFFFHDHWPNRSDR